jgi:hypothetical protein
MNEDQQAVYIAFVVNYADMMHENKVSRHAAAAALEMAASALLGALDLDPDTCDEQAVTDEANTILTAALVHCYGPKKTEVPA